MKSGSRELAERAVELTVGERYALANLLPNDGNFVQLTVVKNMRTRLELTVDEAERWGFERDAGGWKPKNPEEAPDLLERVADVALTERMWDLATETLRKLDGDGRLHITQLGLYEKLVIAPEREEQTEVLREAEQLARRA